jgi:hypothetical protein
MNEHLSIQVKIMHSKLNTHPFYTAFVLSVILSACLNTNEQQIEIDNKKTSGIFSIIVIPDTQNSIDYRRQKKMGFAIDSSELFIDQMTDIANKKTKKHENLAFVTSVGDVWQHQTQRIDKKHQGRGFPNLDDPKYNGLIEITDKTKTFEIPTGIKGYQRLSNANIPFGVAPGNHDYDAAWFETTDRAHIGGLTNFLSVFSNKSTFYKDKPWYIASYQNGTSSAQIFNGAGYQFLHFSLEMLPSNDVLRWMQSVVNKYIGLPTIISTHDYLNVAGERKSAPVLDLALAEPEFHNSAEQLWQKFIKKNEQVFMVLCGHQLGQAMRIDKNDAGYPVYQLLANYQGRGQAGIDAGQSLETATQPFGIGDGWYREMVFDFTHKIPAINVFTYSSHYKKYSSEVKRYADWYKPLENPSLSDEDFYALDEFTISLNDFYQRFGNPVR